MNHPLPIRPAFLPAPPEPEIPASLLASSSTAPPSSSSTDPTLCVICANPSPKYTCPGCLLRTCSLACSKGHKERYTCTGQRDTTAFVPLKDVTEGVWSDDYRYLEEGRRKIAEWGMAMPRGAGAGEGSRGRGGGARGDRGRGRGRGRGGAGGFGGGTGDVRAAGLGRQLELRGVGVEFMPEGMERRKKNQSSWNQKTETLYLTVQLLVPNEMVEPGKPGVKTYTHSRVAVPPASSSTVCSTPQALLPPEMADAKPDELVFAMPYHTLDKETILPKGEKFFPPLDGAKPLIDVLRGTAFVEHPTIHVLKRDVWEAKVRQGEIVVMPLTATHGSTPDAGYAGRLAGQKRKAESVEDETSSQVARTTVVPAPAVVALAPASIPPPASLPARPSTAAAAPAAPLGLGLGDYGSDEDDEE